MVHIADKLEMGSAASMANRCETRTIITTGYVGQTPLLYNFRRDFFTKMHFERPPGFVNTQAVAWQTFITLVVKLGRRESGQIYHSDVGNTYANSDWRVLTFLPFPLWKIL